jgi:hypothetical protein
MVHEAVAGWHWFATDVIDAALGVGVGAENHTTFRVDVL